VHGVSQQVILADDVHSAGDQTGDAPSAPRPARHVSAGLRIAIAFLVGLAVALPIAALSSWWLFPLLAWDVACVVYASWVWMTIWPRDAVSTARVAVHVDPTRAIADLLVQAAAIASLAAVGVVLGQAAKRHGAEQVLLAALGVVSVALSWIVVHTVYTLRYARLYYTPPEGGIQFAGSEPPRFSDFAYLALTLGMTYQVSDTNLETNRFRKLALGQCLLAYVFGTVIVAATVNLVVSLG
jgi:uncharacterized membrane protein